MTELSEDAELGARLERAAMETIVGATDILRAVWALRQLREDSSLLTHDGSAVPDDCQYPACDDEPPEVRVP